MGSSAHGQVEGRGAVTRPDDPGSNPATDHLHANPPRTPVIGEVRGIGTYFHALYRAAQLIASSLEVGDVLDNLAQSVVEAMGVKACALRLLDPQTQTMRLSAAYGLSNEYLTKGPVDIGHSAIDYETLENHMVMIRDVRIDGRFMYRREAEREGIVSVLCVPLRAKGVAIGVMRAYTDHEHTFSAEEIEFLTALADLGALCIANARLYAASRQEYTATMAALWGEGV